VPPLSTLTIAASSLAEPGGYVRVFLKEDQPIFRLLVRLRNRGVRGTLVNRLLATFGAGNDRPSANTARLTPREHDVLHLLALGLPNRAIAERLVTSESTVKSHVHHVIDKLDVRVRAEVPVRARELGILESVIRPAVGG
jgi:LuxR family maltose regulon positive regulatory protein